MAKTDVLCISQNFYKVSSNSNTVAAPQGVGAKQDQLHGQQEPGHLLVAHPAPVRVRGPREVREHEAPPGGRRPDIHRPVQVPLLRPGGGDDGVEADINV